MVCLTSTDSEFSLYIMMLKIVIFFLLSCWSWRTKLL